MKRLFNVFKILLLGLLITSCDLYYDSNRTNMEVVAIRIYDESNNVIEGEYLSYWLDIKKDYLLDANETKLNSAAPIERYYKANINENTNYKVEFVLKSKNNLTLKSLILTNDPEGSIYSEDKFNVNDIRKENNYFVATLNVNINSDTFYRTVGYETKTEIYHFSTKGSNTYIKGAYLVIK